MPNSSEPKQRGCFFYGCLSVLILAIAFVVASYFGVRYAVGKGIETFTSSDPMELPVVQVTDAEWEALDQSVTRFKQNLETNTGPVELVLTSADINALIQRSPDFKDLKDRIYVELLGEQIQAQVSVPLDKVGEIPLLGGAKGRYLNGTARLSAELRDNLLEVHLEDLTVGEQALPEQAKQALQKENLAKEMYRNPEGMKFIEKLDSLTVTNSQLILRMKSGEQAPETLPPLEMPEAAVPAENP